MPATWQNYIMILLNVNLYRIIFWLSFPLLELFLERLKRFDGHKTLFLNFSYRFYLARLVHYLFEEHPTENFVSDRFRKSLEVSAEIPLGGFFAVALKHIQEIVVERRQFIRCHLLHTLCKTYPLLLPIDKHAEE